MADQRMRWANFFHIYQPPHWPTSVITRVAQESYRPLVHFLLRHPQIKITLNISASLTEQLQSNGYRDILAGFRVLLRRKQVEATASAAYHPILPLLSIREARRQIELNERINRRLLGSAYRPVGFFPPEMGYGPRLGRLIADLGYRWVILDGISHPGLVDYRVRTTIAGTRLTPVFRNRYLSDYLAFAADLREAGQFFSTIERWNGTTDVLVTAMDGENLGHHRHAARRLWQTLVRRRDLVTVTVGELLTGLVPGPSIKTRAASWSTRERDLRRRAPFPLWNNPENQLHQLQWALLRQVAVLIQTAERRGPLPPSVRTAYDESLSSDWLWWASREPWWSVDIITAAVHRLTMILHQICRNHTACRPVEQTAEKILALANRWQQTGLAERHAARFLRSEPTPRYLGGERVRLHRQN